MSEFKIPEDEHDNVMGVLWQFLIEVEGSTKKGQDILKAHMVKGAYDLLNRIDYTKHRPRWEKKS